MSVLINDVVINFSTLIYQESMNHSTNGVLLLAQRLRRWYNITTTLTQLFMFAG